MFISLADMSRGHMFLVGWTVGPRRAARGKSGRAPKIWSQICLQAREAHQPYTGRQWATAHRVQCGGPHQNSHRTHQHIGPWETWFAGSKWHLKIRIIGLFWLDIAWADTTWHKLCQDMNRTCSFGPLLWFQQ